MMLSSILPRNMDNILRTALRVCKSGDKIGLYQMLMYAFSLSVIPADAILSLIGPMICKKMADSRLPVILISGYSRSGTTLVYQALAKVWDTEYVNNLIVLFPRSYPLANFIYRKISYSRTSAFKSFYGRTMGLHGTNDGAQLLQRWFPDETLSDPGPLPDAAALEIQSFFAMHEFLLKKPAMLKNCNLYLQFEQLANILPNAFFIFIRRNPANIIDSTILAREFVQGNRSKGWEFSLHRHMSDPIREVCMNIKNCYEKIEAFENLATGRFMSIQYEKFCENPVEHVRILGERVFHAKQDEEHLRQFLQPIKPSTALRTGPADQAAILAAVKSVF